MKNSFIKHNQPCIKKEDLTAVENVLRSNWIAQGPQVEELELKFTSLFEGGTACAVSNGTSALFLALKALKVKEGAFVALPTYACSALLNAIYLAGAKPILVDVLDDTFCIDPREVEKYASVANYIIAVHTFGSIANLDRLKKNGRQIIEDCCQSLGAEGLHNTLGHQSDISVFSFYATKLVAGGQGGMVWSKNRLFIDNIFDYRQFDCREEYKPRFNFQMTDINAALINSQMERLKANCERRKQIAKYYSSSLHESFVLQSGTCEEKGVPYRYVLKAENVKIRNKLLNHMNSKNVECVIPIQRYELLHRYLKLDPKLFPVSENLADTTISIPIHACLSDDDVNYIKNALTLFKP